jgi:hypothetical protein
VGVRANSGRHSVNGKRESRGRNAQAHAATVILESDWARCDCGFVVEFSPASARAGPLGQGSGTIAGSARGRGASIRKPERNKANAYFADGIQDEIITRLAKIGELKVISRSSTQRYRSKGENVTEIARQLGVAPVVEGSVQKVGDRVRINIQGSGRRARAEDDLPIGTRARSS